MSSQETQLIVVIGKDKQFSEDKDFPVEQVFFAIGEAFNKKLHLYNAYKDGSVEITVNKDRKIEQKSSLRGTVKLAQKVFNEVIDSENKKCKLLLFSALLPKESPVRAALLAWQTVFKIKISPSYVRLIDLLDPEQFFSHFFQDKSKSKSKVSAYWLGIESKTEPIENLLFLVKEAWDSQMKSLTHSEQRALLKNRGS